MKEAINNFQKEHVAYKEGEFVDNYRNFDIYLYQDRLYIYPPQEWIDCGFQSVFITCGEYNKVFYGHLGMSPTDVARLTIDESIKNFFSKAYTPWGEEVLPLCPWLELPPIPEYYLEKDRLKELEKKSKKKTRTSKK